MGQALLVRRGGSGTGNVFAFIVATYPAGSTCTCSNGKKTLTAKGTTIPYVFFIPEAGTWTVTSTNGTDSATVDVVISSAGQSESVSLNYSILLSNISVTGVEGTDYITTDEGNGNWNIRILTSQTVTPLQAGKLDVFCVGGGGGGDCDYSSSGWGGGGGGGYTITSLAVDVEAAIEYTVTIGAGGTGGMNNGAKQGGTTSAFGVEAVGGNPGSKRSGGSGGSGGGAGKTDSLAGGDGGSDGSDGGADANGYGAGTGQNTTTRAFGEEDGELFAGGGGGSGKSCGDGGGADNTGGGGNGNSKKSNVGNNGYSGIVIFRNARGAA